MQVRVSECAEQLIGNVSENSDFDMFLKGMIRAYREAIGVQFIDVQSTEEIFNDEIQPRDLGIQIDTETADRDNE